MNQSPLTSAFTRFRDRLRRMASGIVGSDEEAEDVLHDAFCRLWARNASLSSEAEAIRLSYTAVRNQAIDNLRKRAVGATVPVETVADRACEDSYGIDRSEVYAAVLRLSRSVLNERQYAVFNLHDVQGMPYDEVAARMGMTAENVRMTLSRARKAIREVYRNSQIRN